MHKSTIAAALALVFVVNCEASAMTLVSLRPNLMRAAKTAQLKPLMRPSALGWLITIATTTVETLTDKLVNTAPASQPNTRKTYDI